MEWFDFDRIYNQTSTSSGLASVDERVSCESEPCNVAREAYVPVGRGGAPSPVREMGTMTHVDDFPFVMAKLFSHAEVTDTPVVSRAEEEAHMVRAESAEDGCSHAHNCECMRMFSEEERFVMKRFVVGGGAQRFVRAVHANGGVAAVLRCAREWDHPEASAAAVPQYRGCGGGVRSEGLHQLRQR